MVLHFTQSKNPISHNCTQCSTGFVNDYFSDLTSLYYPLSFPLLKPRSSPRSILLQPQGLCTGCSSAWNTLLYIPAWLSLIFLNSAGMSPFQGGPCWPLFQVAHSPSLIPNHSYPSYLTEIFFHGSCLQNPTYYEKMYLSLSPTRDMMSIKAEVLSGLFTDVCSA